MFFNITIFLLNAHVNPILQRNNCVSEKTCNALENNYTLEGAQQRDEENKKLFLFFNIILGTVEKVDGCLSVVSVVCCQVEVSATS